jgi:DNA adenine methylase
VTAPLKPPLIYYGSKVTIGPQIAALLPPHDHYVEPYAGSLSVLLAKRPSRMETVNDLDHRLMTFWRVLRERPAELERRCALTPHARAEHDTAYTDSSDEMEQARRVWVRLTQGRAGTLRRTGWRYYVNPAGSSASMPDYLHGYVDRMAASVERLAAVSLECRPALDVIAAYGAQAKVLLYVDPPYLGSTRTRNYLLEMPSEKDHRQLAGALHAAKSAVVLSGYESPLYNDLYDGWHRHEIRAATGQAHAWSARTEVLWSNRPLLVADQLFADEVTP